MRRRKSLASGWLDLAMNSMQLMHGSATVIGKRTAAMLAAGPDPSLAQKREMRRMVDEKASAAIESWTRIAFASAGVYQAMAMTAIFAGRTPTNIQLQRAAIKVLGAATVPYRAKVRGNVKRLGGK